MLFNLRWLDKLHCTISNTINSGWGLALQLACNLLLEYMFSLQVVKNKQALTHGNHCNAIHDVVDMCALLSADISTLTD